MVQDATCTQTPINREYAQSYREWVLYAYPNKIREGPCRTKPLRYSAHCEAQKCTSKAEPLD
jgi:hypothetical protein